MSNQIPILSRTFYIFSAIHSFLLGLLPIFIPVMLWDKGLIITDIAWFIVLTAVGFLISLWFWDRLRAKANWSLIIASSFITQMLLVGLLIQDELWLLLSIGALINGAAGCFYWSTQRILFQAITSDKNTGNTFGNFQILVALALKFGILIGSFLLDSEYINSLLFLSFSGSIVGFYLLTRLLKQTDNLLNNQQPSAFSLAHILAFKDGVQSKKVFMIDGLFLFLESYFWVLMLYMITQENLMKLGFLIVILSIVLAIIFFIIKRVIDRVNTSRLFMISVVGYAFSWFLRGQLSFQSNDIMLYGSVLLIAFLTSFFRLAFNKRFYDIANKNEPIYYILCKSYYSQFMIIFFFSLIALFAPITGDAVSQLQIIFGLAIPLVFIYLLYGTNKEQ